MLMVMMLMIMIKKCCSEGSSDQRPSKFSPQRQQVGSPGGHKRSEEDLVDLKMAKRQRMGEEQPVTPDDSMLDAGERSPCTHEDERVCFHLEENDLNKFEQYELEFYDDEWLLVDDDVSQTAVLTSRAPSRS